MQLIKDDLGEDVYALKRFDSGAVATVTQLTYGRARITLSLVPGSGWYDDGW